jgi:hypothetical protein
MLRQLQARSVHVFPQFVKAGRAWWNLAENSGLQLPVTAPNGELCYRFYALKNEEPTLLGQ